MPAGCRVDLEVPEKTVKLLRSGAELFQGNEFQWPHMAGLQDNWRCLPPSSRGRMRAIRLRAEGQEIRFLSVGSVGDRGGTHCRLLLNVPVESDSAEVGPVGRLMF